MPQRHSANIYIDGFNLYYGLVRYTNNKWLNVHKLVNSILPYIDINRTEYFTADVTPRPDDPDKGNRQKLYYRALLTLPNLKIIKGNYLVKSVKMCLADDYPAKINMVNVIKTEEKGSDVNLATHLLRDAFLNRFQTAVVITNDSDLYEPIRICRQDLNKYIYVLNPHSKTPAFHLKHAASSFISIRKNIAANCQFANPLQDVEGTFYKPSTW